MIRFIKISDIQSVLQKGNTTVDFTENGLLRSMGDKEFKNNFYPVEGSNNQFRSSVTNDDFLCYDDKQYAAFIKGKSADAIPITDFEYLNEDMEEYIAALDEKNALLESKDAD